MKFSQHFALRVCAAFFAFVALVFAGAVAVDHTCFPAYSHGVPVQWECDAALFTPAFAAFIAGVIVGWQSSRRAVLHAVLAVLVGVIAAVPLGYLRHWYGSDIVYAAVWALFGCVLPAALGGVLSSQSFKRGGRHAL